MKYLKIENNKVFFKNSDDEWKEIDNINKNHLLYLLNNLITEEDFEMDEFNEDNISNKAHQIIYKSLYEKFKSLKDNRTRFYDESRELYREAFERYQVIE